MTPTFGYLTNSNASVMISSINKRSSPRDWHRRGMEQSEVTAMFNDQCNTPLSYPQTTPAAFLRQLAAALDTAALRAYARAEVSARYGNAEASVRETSKAIDYETHAETLRLKAERLADQRAADIARDTREMMVEGYTAHDIGVYVRRNYGEAVSRG
jgi:hypothetical protein